ncbi:S8 family serine peptidase [Hymenobacter arizonensis]|uniref:S8 family serine peptidase n=1 Tax=Hymenobacter arizonensis TaxID=1227077 RepID=UPI0015A623B8|nr:S8 family serine peptidase [Hymenobacter arizonensis]
MKFRQLQTGTALEFNGKNERARTLKADKISKALLKADARLMRQAAGKGFGQNVSRIFQVELDGSRTSVKELIAELKAMPEVEYAELVPIYYIHAAPSDQGYTAGQQYSLNITKAVQAFSSFNGTAAPVRVAIVDDAVLISHPDLAANIWRNAGEMGLDANGNNKATNGIDDDGNGYIDDLNGWDAADKDNNPNPPTVRTANGNLAGPNTFSHGTHCAGIAGAVTNNGVGVASVSYNRVQIVPVKCTFNNAPNTRAINTSFDGLAYAIRGAKANVVSMSFGGSGYSQAFQDLISEGADTGTVIIASAGNNNNDIEQYPANYQNVISVSNTDAGDKKSSSSSFGSWVTIAAPGTNILSTVAGEGTAAQIAAGSYINYTGTSMSGPMVAGLVGFIKAQNPSLTPAQIKQILTSTADNVDVLNAGFEGLLGTGRINAYQAIVAAGGTALAPTVDFISNKTSAVIGEEVAFANRSTGDNLTYSWTFQNANIATSSAKNPVVKFTAAGSHEVKLTINGGASKTMVINVSGFTSTDILGLPLAGTVGASGINGHSNNNIPAIANLYKYSTGHLIAGVNISFRLAIPLTPSSTIRVKVWESERGLPGRALYTQTVKISDLKANNLVSTLSPNYFYFDKPVQVPANSNFYVGIEYDYPVPFVATAPRDNVSIHHVNSPAAGTDAAVFFNNSWQINAQVGVAWTFAMFPILADAAQYPAGTFTVSTKEACVNNAVDFNASSITNASAYRWAFGNGATAEEATASATYAAAGTFMPTLTATRNVSITKGGVAYPVELRQTFSQMLRVADCATAPVASFQASALSANVGSTITFSNTTTNATSYEWLISQGGTRIRSTEESPVITFATKGKYDVTLTTRNPKGEIAQLTKKQYVEIFTAGQDCGTADFLFPTRLTSFGAAAGGTFSGHNGNGIANYAKAFDLTAGTVVTKAMLNVLSAVATAPAASFITVNVWNAEGPDGTPGQVLSSAKVSYTKLMQAVANNRGNIEAVLEKHVVLPAGGRIYVGYTINYTPGDNLVVGSLLAGPNMGDRSLFLFGGDWYTLKEILSIQSEYAIAIATFNNIDKLPIANFTVSASKVAVGEAIRLDASSSKKAQVYNWEVVGGTLTSMGETAASANYDPTKAAVSFSKPGVYNITLVAMGDCGAKVATKTIQVEVGAVAKGTIATSADSKAAGATEVSVSESVVYPNPSNGQYNLVLKGEAQQKVLVTVLDMAGKEVTSKSVTLSSDSEVHQIDVVSKPAGMYLLRVKAGNKVQFYRVVKN